jgi:hypothetical protein
MLDAACVLILLFPWGALGLLALPALRRRLLVAHIRLHRTHPSADPGAPVQALTATTSRVDANR